MTGFEILMACVGMILCAVIFALIAVLVAGVVWWTFKTENVMQKDEYLNKNEDEYKA